MEIPQGYCLIKEELFENGLFAKDDSDPESDEDCANELAELCGDREKKEKIVMLMKNIHDSVERHIIAKREHFFLICVAVIDTASA